MVPVCIFLGFQTYSHNVFSHSSMVDDVYLNSMGQGDFTVQVRDMKWVVVLGVFAAYY